MKPTAHDAAAVSEETKKVIDKLERAATIITPYGFFFSSDSIREAIDRLIILDNAAQARQAETDPRVITFTDSDARALLEDGAS